ncbi:MAG: RNA methyltransferase [Pseudomonadota bacterium]
MKGYFGIGIVSVSKVGNAGNLIRTANAFGAQFVFMVAPDFRRHIDKFDTAKTASAIPVFEAERFDDLTIPNGAELVGIELCDEAVALPSFAHPRRALYVLGGERVSLSAQMQSKCDYLIKIPTKFSLNVATAGAIVMYDRMRALAQFGERPMWPKGHAEPRQQHQHGGPITRTGKLGKTQ